MGQASEEAEAMMGGIKRQERKTKREQKQGELHNRGLDEAFAKGGDLVSFLLTKRPGTLKEALERLSQTERTLLQVQRSEKAALQRAEEALEECEAAVDSEKEMAAKYEAAEVRSREVAAEAAKAEALAEESVKAKEEALAEAARVVAIADEAKAKRESAESRTADAKKRADIAEADNKRLTEELTAAVFAEKEVSEALAVERKTSAEVGHQRRELETEARHLRKELEAAVFSEAAAAEALAQEKATAAAFRERAMTAESELAKFMRRPAWARLLMRFGLRLGRG